MSLFFLTNTATGPNGGQLNNDYNCSFRDVVAIPPHARVSLEQAYIPINSQITIIQDINDKIYLRFRAPGGATNMIYPSPASAPIVTISGLNYQVITLVAGTYSPNDFMAMIQTALNDNFQNPLSLCRVGDAVPAIWSSTAVPPLPPPSPGDYFTDEWSAECSYSYTTNQFLIKLKTWADLTLIPRSRDLVIGIWFAQPFITNVNPDLINQNSLAYIFNQNYEFNFANEPVQNFGNFTNTFVLTKPSTGAEQISSVDYLSGSARFNGKGVANGIGFQGAFMIEIPELGTQLYNSKVRTKFPAIGCVPYDLNEDLPNGFVIYQPQFPLELMCANEAQYLLNSLSVRIREIDGQLADCYNTIERTYIVVRIETDTDIEKQILHEVKKEERRKLIEQSRALIRQPAP
jgi:hypothetical protein